jgi:copper oxidase (laccase) domain-containing protein
MNPKFSIVEQETLSLLVYTPWWEEGILHGMTLSPFSMVGDYPSPQASEFCRATGASLLVAPKQTHGALFFDARDGESLKDPHNGRGSLARCGEYDGVLVPMSQNLPRETVAYAIATADCVPVVMRGDAGWGLAHAGWRGLANGIIQNVARGLGEVEEVAIFACAGGSAYEVGREVIDAIGETAAFVATGDSFLLDTAETARRQLLPYVAAEAIETSGICTIRDPRFHSYRRDGAQSGRSLTFVSPPSIYL